jgi:hypothetical protein
MTGDEMARQQHDADLLEDLAEDLELDGEAGDGVRGGASADALSKTSLLQKGIPQTSAPAGSKTTSSPADLLKSSLMDKTTT